MLNGIGGETIAEAQERVTAEEAHAWAAYMRKRGSLHVGMRLEYGFALLAVIISNALGGKRQLHDFMPHAERTATIEDIMAILSGKQI